MLHRLSALFGDIPIAGVVAILAVVVVQLTLQIVGLVDLARRRTVPGGKKWVWAVVIVLGNLIGAIVYLAVGRSAPPPEGGAERAGGRAARDRAIDKLYGNGPDR